MIYQYCCYDCGKKFEVYKTIAEREEPERCPFCDEINDENQRIIFPKGQTFLGEKVEHEEYCPALGCVVKSSKHRKELAKSRGWIEIGNENPDKIHEKVEHDREQKSRDSYKEFLDTAINLSGK